MLLTAPTTAKEVTTIPAASSLDTLRKEDVPVVSKVSNKEESKSEEKKSELVGFEAEPEDEPDKDSKPEDESDKDSKSKSRTYHPHVFWT